MTLPSDSMDGSTGQTLQTQTREGWVGMLRRGEKKSICVSKQWGPCPGAPWHGELTVLEGIGIG